MIKGVNLISQTLFRAPDWFDASEDWTRTFYWRQNGTPAANSLTAWLLSSDQTYTLPYIWIGCDAASNNLYVEFFNGSTTVDTSKKTTVNGTDYFIGITYVASTHTLSFYVDNVLFDDITFNLDAFAPGKEFLLDGGGNGDFSQAYERTWQRVLNVTEMTAESASITPVSMTMLLTDCPLQTSVDLTDHNLNLRQWWPLDTTVEGCVTDTDDPLLAVIAGPPTNTSPGDALSIDLTSAVFQSTLTAGAATDVWFTYQSVADDNVLGLIAFGDLTTYKPRMNVYGSLQDAIDDNEYQVGNVFLESTQNRAIQFPVKPALTTFYFKVLRNAAVSPATVIMSLVRGLDLEVPVGTIGINEDVTQGFPLVLMDATYNYPIRFIQDWPGGEGGCTLDDGTTIFGIEATGVYKIFDADFVLVATVTLTSGYEWASGNGLDAFIVSSHGVNSEARIVFPDGSLNPLVYSIPGTIQSIGLSRDQSIIYYTVGGVVKRWDAVNNIALTDLAAAIAGYSPNKSEIIVMSNGNVVVGYIKGTVTRDYKCLVYSSTGTIVSTSVGIGAFVNSANRIASASTDPTDYMTWTKIAPSPAPNGWNRIFRIKSADGVVQTNVASVEYSFCQYVPAATNIPYRFGHADSCPFFVVKTAVFPPSEPGGGIYSLTGTNSTNPRIDHDEQWVDATVGSTTSVAINNPFAETYLAGDE